MLRNDERLVLLQVRWTERGEGMNDWVDSPVLVLRRWHGVGLVRQVRAAICSCVYMNDESKRSSSRAEGREGEGLREIPLSCRFYTVADNIMNPFMIHLLSLCQLCNFVIGSSERSTAIVYYF